jgi:Glutamine amidotransferase class-I
MPAGHNHWSTTLTDELTYFTALDAGTSHLRNWQAVAVAIDGREVPLGELRVRSPAAQAGRLVAWAMGWPERTWAVEGAAGLGHLLAQQLVAAGERALDVQPKLGARVRLLATGATNKNNPNDARSVAIVARRSTARQEQPDEHSAVLKVWFKRHRDLGWARTQVACRLHAAPEPLPTPADVSATSLTSESVTIAIALVGDETDHPSHHEINAARALLGDDVEATWTRTDSARIRDLAGFDGVWLVPGSPYADDQAAYAAITWARERKVPFLGTCGGLQYAVIEFFRNVLGHGAASHAESDGEDASNVVTALACSLQARERQIRPVPGTRFAALMGGQPSSGMHFCSYAPAPQHVQRLVDAGMIVEATADDAGAEVLELPDNAFYMLSLFQPQIGSLAGKPLHPLLSEFVRCAREYSEQASHTVHG